MMNDKKLKQLAAKVQQNNSVARMIAGTTYIPNPPKKKAKASKRRF
jgi:hypothetical protein